MLNGSKSNKCFLWAVGNPSHLSFLNGHLGQILSKQNKSIQLVTLNAFKQEYLKGEKKKVLQQRK